MANPSVANVVAALPVVTGGVSAAALGTALPTSLSTSLNVSFKALGFVGDAGLSNTVTRTTDNTKAWGGNTVATIQSDYSDVYTFTFLETLNSDVAKTVWGDANVTVTPATSTTGTLLAILHNVTPVVAKSFVFDMFSGSAKRRIVVPIGNLALSGDVTYVHSAIVSYPVTVTALPDASGNTAYEYTDDGIHTP